MPDEMLAVMGLPVTQEHASYTSTTAPVDLSMLSESAKAWVDKTAW